MKRKSSKTKETQANSLSKARTYVPGMEYDSAEEAVIRGIERAAARIKQQRLEQEKQEKPT